ncbi:DNA methyltransferase [Dongia deserti]|uniref:DNA methyltransferase n=1 Tax=Dongia deserti TaxID=2268030 RepID=UPI000E64A537|nr:DNA methyltransferase [Dongia deserti]
MEGTSHPALARDEGRFAGLLAGFSAFGTATRQVALDGVSVFENEFWTARQRQAHPLHEISYRACFKPQLPRFFIEAFTQPGGCVYDPFAGRGTTLIEAALLGRRAIGNDVNPLSRLLIEPRLDPPAVQAVAKRLGDLERMLPPAEDVPDDLLAFYHPETLRDIARLRAHFLSTASDSVDAWIRMVCLNRLTGHSSGFFSVYTLPPNQATSAARQRKINEARGQVPSKRDVFEIVLRKTKALLKAPLPPGFGGTTGRVLTGPAESTPSIPDRSVDLIVTSPPFLDVVDYPMDNWLRCWFAGIDPNAVPITLHRSLADWEAFVASCFREFARIVRPGGKVAFEVGEVRGGKVALEHAVLSAAKDLPFEPLVVMINRQSFTKTAQCWGVDNNAKGTNSNRIVVFERR